MDLSRYQLEKLREDKDFALYRAHQANVYAPPLLVLTPTLQNMGDSYLRRFENEHSLAAELDSAWAIKPLSLVHYGRRMALVLEDPGGRPLSDLLGKPLQGAQFLRIAVGLVESLRKLHERGLIHKDVRPANVFLNAGGRVLLTGFGFASRLMRERQPLAAPQSLDAALAYIAPERTGRMNRSIDARSDLYSLGITLFEMLVGALPFTTADPTELIHCHVARRPPSPSERITGIPAPLEAVILKLLAKSAEDRYQTAAGVEFDLRRCLASLSTTGQIGPFQLGERDIADQLLIPEQLYSRETELDALIETFEQVATLGRSGFLLVCGPSGIGKSSIVTELRRAPQARRGLFAEGRADQFRRDVPYASVAEAFRGLLKQILCQDEFQLERWRESLQQALGSSGQLIVDLIPELALIIGAQPTLMNVPPQEERNRFFPVFRRFLSVFARPEHPLVLFLDNLQWLDTATLELLERLAADREIPHLLLIGTCRTDDSDALSGARRMLPLFAADGRAAREIELAPLTPGDVRDLVAKALRADTQYVSPLAELVHAKTQGNCFFVRQFLTALNVENLLQFETATGRWRWDLEGIRAKGITDNVATLMAATLARYDAAALVSLKYLACLGASAESSMLARIMEVPVEVVHDAMRSPLNDDLLHRIGATYDFSHDRVREAAYALIPETDKPAMHLRIARLLASGMDPQAPEDGIFGLLNHYQQGAALIESASEKVFLAQLNLIAGKRAKAATAYESALRYFAAGREVLGRASPDEHYELSFGLEFYEADCKFITGDLDFAREQLARLCARARSETDRALVVGRQVMLFTFLGEIDHALRLAIECLAQIGEVLPLHPSDRDVQQEYLDLLQVLGTRPVESLITLPPMANPQLRGVMELLGVLSGPAGAVHLNLLTFVQLRMVRLSVEHGTTDESAHAYAGLSRVLGWSFGELDQGHDFGRLALRFVEERGSSRSAERVYSVLAGCMAPYTMSLRASHDLAVRATEVARELGGLTFSGHSWSLVVSFLLDGGEPLIEVQRRGEAALAVVLEQKFFAAVKMVEIPV